jgi:hypothetical protein
MRRILFPRVISSALLLSAALYTPCLGQETLTSATLTRLPAAIPTDNATDPCAFTDRNSLIDRVESDWAENNVSLLVQTCDSVCVLIYGAGNPDISGIGVSVSFSAIP